MAASGHWNVVTIACLDARHQSLCVAWDVAAFDTDLGELFVPKPAQDMHHSRGLHDLQSCLTCPANRAQSDAGGIEDMKPIGTGRIYTCFGHRDCSPDATHAASSAIRGMSYRVMDMSASSRSEQCASSWKVLLYTSRRCAHSRYRRVMSFTADDHRRETSLGSSGSINSCAMTRSLPGTHLTGRRYPPVSLTCFAPTFTSLTRAVRSPLETANSSQRSFCDWNAALQQRWADQS